MVKYRFIKKLKESVQVDELDLRIYNLLLIISMLAGPLVIAGNIIQGLHIIAIINPVIITAINLVLYYLSVQKKIVLKLTLCFSFLIFTAVQWVYNGGGSTGGMQYFFMWTFISATILIRGKELVIYLILNCVILLGLLFYEYYDGSLIVQYKDKSSRLTDIIISASLTFLLASFMIKVIYKEIDKERIKSEKLLLNILPKKVIEELKKSGSTNPVTFQNVTVLFSDIVGFTDISTRLPVETLIKELNDIFTRFDVIIEENACERIKTIGDAYMAVCGLPEYNADHCRNIVNAAIEMMRDLNNRNGMNSVKWEIRIGIHSGQVIGSVVGRKKYIYDVFGDTVNTASRLQSLSEPMKINISSEVKESLGDNIDYEDRGTIKVRGKEEMRMFYVNYSYSNN